MATCAGLTYAGVSFSENDAYISYLPMAHAFEQGLFALSVCNGIKIGFYGGDVLKLTGDC